MVTWKDPAENCRDCCGLFNHPASRSRFGILNEYAFSHCRDICTQEVQLICAKPVDLVISLPSLCDGLDSGCRGEIIPLPPGGDCSILVTCAEEALGPDCDRVFANVGIQLLLTSATGVIVIEKIIPLECTEFFTFPQGEAVSGSALKQALKMIDGSCVVVQLECEILDCGGPRVRVCGNIVEKLWKHENLWIEAVRPYRGIMVEQEFAEPHRIEPCTPIDDKRTRPHHIGPCAPTED